MCIERGGPGKKECRCVYREENLGRKSVDVYRERGIREERV